jgi:hypothetical protein
MNTSARAFLFTCLVAATTWAAAQPVARRKPPPPPYYADERFNSELPTDDGRVSRDKLADGLRQVTGAAFVVPAAAFGFDLMLPAGKRRARDVMDLLADVMLGKWSKVEGAYVLVLEPRLLDAAAMEPRERERAARRIVRELLGTLSPEQARRLAGGLPLTRIDLAVVQMPYLVELGTIGYYEAPMRRDPSALRGEGVSITYAAKDTAAQAEIWLPTRAGKPVLWQREIVPLIGGG